MNDGESWILQITGPIKCPECGEKEGLRITDMRRIARTGGDLGKLKACERVFADLDERMDFYNGGGILHLEGECLHEFDVAFSLHHNMLFMAHLADKSSSSDNGNSSDSSQDDTGQPPVEGNTASPDSKPAAKTKRSFAEIDEEERERIAEDWRTGAKPDDLKARYGLNSYQTVFRILSAQGIESSQFSKSSAADNTSRKNGKRKNGKRKNDELSHSKMGSNATDETPSNPADTPVSKLSFVSQDLISQLEDAGIGTVGDLSTFSASDLESYGIGRGSVITLRAALNKLGVELAD